jgi:hypothetical protein
MYNHVINHKHQRNWLIAKHSDDHKILSLTKNEVVAKVSEHFDRVGLEVNQINEVWDAMKYKELRNRPKDWSEKKVKAGLVGSAMNANFTALGPRPSAAAATATATPSSSSSPPLSS